MPGASGDQRLSIRVGAENVAAATAYSDSLPQSERDPARAFADELGVQVLTPRTAEMEREGYRANDGDRCAFCKAELLDVLGPLAEHAGTLRQCCAAMAQYARIFAEQVSPASVREAAPSASYVPEWLKSSNQPSRSGV